MAGSPGAGAGAGGFYFEVLAQREIIITKVCVRPRTAKFREFLATGPQPRGRGQAPKARPCRRDMGFPVFNGSRGIAVAARFVPPKNVLKFPSSLITWLKLKKSPVQLGGPREGRGSGIPAGVLPGGL